jgi:hypothetical protein
MRRSGFALALVLAVLGAMPARADIASDCAEWRKSQGPGTALPTVCLAEKDALPPPKFEGIGATTRPLFMSDDDIQNHFDQGLRFYYAFNFREAYRAFRWAAQLGQSRKKPCGYCYWGIAASLSVAPGSFLTLEPDRRAARDALNTAKTIFAPDKKQALGLVAALLARTEDCKPLEDCADKRRDAYYKVIKPLWEANPNDPEITVLFVDSVLGVLHQGMLAEGRKALKSAMASPLNARHTGLWHWSVLFNEWAGTPMDAEADADRLRGMAPDAGQMQHSPSHIYYLLGRMDKAQVANDAAVVADEKYFNDTRDKLEHPNGDVYKYGSYPHELHFLLASALMRGNRDVVELVAKRLLAAPPKEPGGYRQDFYRAMYYLGRMPLATTKEIEDFPKPDPLPKQPLANIAYYYALTRMDFWKGKTDSPFLKQLDSAVDAYPEKKMCPDDLKNYHVEPCLVAIMSNLAHAYQAAATKSWNVAFNKGQAAAELQKRIGDGLPGVWYLPVNQAVASLYIRAALGEHKPPQDYLRKAQQLLNTSLDFRPGNGWAYFGLWEVAKHIDGGKPADAEKAFRANWLGDPPALDRM